MTDEQQPDVRWAPIEPKPRNRGRVWLIVGLVIAVLVIVGVLLFFLLPRDGAPTPEGSGSPTPSTTSSAPGEPRDDPTAPPVTEAPEPVDPTVEAFRGQVEAWLSDGARGLDIVASSSGEEALSSVGILQEDAERLSGVIPPSSIADEWRDGVSAYSQKLVDVRDAVSGGGDASAALDSARTALQDLSTLVGL